jgi:hypothetical protein
MVRLPPSPNLVPQFSFDLLLDSPNPHVQGFIGYDSVEQIRRKEAPCKRAIFSFIFLLTD